MKMFFPRVTCPSAALVILLLLAHQAMAQDFQRIFGTTLDNSFSKIIQDGTDYYVLGQEQPMGGSLPHATVTRLDANGIHQWTLQLDIPSIWNDAVLTPIGDLMVVGSTLPNDATNQSLIGLVTATGGGDFTWVRSYDVAGRENLFQIVRSPNPETPGFPYYVLGTQFDPTGSGALWDDVILMNLDETGTFNWKKIYDLASDDEFVRDLEVMPNGDLMMAGNTGSQGVIFVTDNTGTGIGGATPSGLSFSYYDVTPSSNGGFYAIGSTFPSFNAHLMKYDADLIGQWEVTISDLTALTNVWEDPSGGKIYVTGTMLVGGLSRSVILLFTDTGSTATLDWVKYLDDGESAYTVGRSTFISSNLLGYADGRVSTTIGHGQLDAFMSISDLLLTSCMTREDAVDVTPISILYDGPLLPPITFYDHPMGTDLTKAGVNWEQEDVCNQAPCSASFDVVSIDGCGQYQIISTSTGQQPLTYQWCDGSTSPTVNVNLSCGPHTFCVTVTCANGDTSSATQTIIVMDTIPPVALCALPVGITLDSNCEANITVSMIDAGSYDDCEIQSMSVSPNTFIACGQYPVTLTVTDWCGNTATCMATVEVVDTIPPIIVCPPDMFFSTIGTNCDLIVNGLQWISATDNCGAPLITYNITGASSYSGTGDASGLSFNDGISFVTYTATDICGNSNTCSFQIVVDCKCPCINNLLQNPGFTLGGAVGNLGYNVPLSNWLPATESPYVNNDTYGCDPFSIFQWSHATAFSIWGESFYQSGLAIVAGHKYRISFRAIGSVRYGFNGTNTPVASNFNPYNCSTCENFGTSAQISASGWAIYTLPIWTANQNSNALFIRAISTLFNSGRIDNICMQEVFYTCCGDEEAFVANARNAIHVYADPSGEEAIFEVGNLPECDSIAYIDWGDGEIEVGPFAGNFVRRHRFLDHLLARIEYQVNEYSDENPMSEPCFEHIFIDSLEVGGPDTCVCLGFADMYMRSRSGDVDVQIEYDTIPAALDCPEAGSGYDFTGSFQCGGSACTDVTQIIWTLTGPDGTTSDTALANPYFIISLLPTYFSTPGVYTLTIVGQCGDNFCEYVTEFIIDCDDLCPCASDDIQQFQQAVDAGFARVMRPDYGCSVSFSPVALDDCETVEWYLESGNVTFIGTSSGNNSFSYTFSGSGTYSIIMVATRLKSDGTLCETFSNTQSVTVSCLPPDDCGVSLIGNPGFSEGAIAGGLNSGGATNEWGAVSGDPFVIEGEIGSSDSWSIHLSGNLDTTDVLSPLEAACLVKGPGTLRTTVKSSKSNSSERTFTPTLNFLLGTGWAFPPTFKIDECDISSCYTLASIQIPATDSAEWVEIEIPFDLSDWDAFDDCGGVVVRPMIYVTNPLGTDQGGPQTYSYVQIDDICFDGMIVSVGDLPIGQDVRIYPNPNRGTFTVELADPVLNDMSMYVTTTTGQILLEKNIIPNSQLQTIEANDLPQGLYFLHIISDGRIMSVHKFVKQ